MRTWFKLNKRCQDVRRIQEFAEAMNKAGADYITDEFDDDRTLSSAVFVCTEHVKNHDPIGVRVTLACEAKNAMSLQTGVIKRDCMNFEKEHEILYHKEVVWLAKVIRKIHQTVTLCENADWVKTERPDES